jgi:superfamily II RNA helicase
VVFVGLVHESRRRGEERWIPSRTFGRERKQVDRILSTLVGVEARHGVPTPMKTCDWGLSQAVLAWCQGASIDELLLVCDAGPGDLCRTFRMAIQLLRQVQRAIDPDLDSARLAERLAEARRRLDRDEIDARRQLDLG